MKHPVLRMALAATALSAAFVTPVAAAELLAGIGGNNILVTFASDDPMSVS